MDNLWKKERIGPCYINIFESVPSDAIQFTARCLEQLKSKKMHKNSIASLKSRVKGNSLFGNNEWAAAMNHYNQSLALAEIGSENEALAYCNRSACFFHMEMYEKVLVDVELALKSNIPDRVKEKILMRKQNAIELLKTTKPNAQPYLKLDFEPNTRYPCMADVIDLRYSKEFGRHMIATQDIPVGKIIMREEEYIGYPNDKELTCKTCFKECVNFIACKQCPSALFCNEDCMNRNSTHKWVCAEGFDDIPLIFDYHIRFVLLALETFKTVDNLMQFVERVLREDPSEMPDANDEVSKYHFVFKLNKNGPFILKALGITYNLYVHLLQIPKVAAVFNSKQKKCFLMHLMVHHGALDATNGFSRDENKGGHSLYINIAIFNHSCNPNLGTIRSDDLLLCATIRPVKKGDQLYISYLGQSDLCDTQRERQAKLQKSWNFFCKCEFCESSSVHWKSLNDYLMLQPNIKFMFLNEDNPAKSDEVKFKVEQFLTTYGHLAGSETIRFIASKFLGILSKKI